MIRITFIVSWFVGVVAIYLLTSRLKSRHETLWIDLDKPGFFLTNSISSGLKLFVFIITWRFRSIQDATVAITGYISWLSILVSMLAMVTMFVNVH